MNVINNFHAPGYEFLSNFFEAPVTWEGLTYPNNEAAFQAAKVLTNEERLPFTTMKPTTAKRQGRRVPLRSDWEEVKTQVMTEVVRAKFTQNPELAALLLATGDAELIEGNTWGDTCWGVSLKTGKGQNRLGKILMQVRAELQAAAPENAHEGGMAMEKKILIVVDMQNDFIDGALGTAEAQAIVPAVIERINACREAGWTLIATLDTHGEDYMNTPEGKKLPVPHCTKGTPGWQIRNEIAAALGDGCTLAEKPTFGSVRLPEIISDMTAGADNVTIELLGLCTDICVVSNALLLKAHFTDAAIAVRRACCAGVTPATHEAALATMGCCQIDVV